MKRLIALAGAAVFAMFAGIEFILPKEDAFYFNPASGAGDYFQVEVRGEIDYHGLYGLARGFSWSGVEVCDTTQRQDSRDEWVLAQDPETHPHWNGLYAPIAEGKYEVKSSDANSICYEITADEDVNIVAPAAGTINTSHYSCNYGSYMEYVVEWQGTGIFTVTIDGAKCWFCCASKTAPSDGRYTATTSDSLKGKSMRAGDVLCVGKKGTKVTITLTSSDSVNTVG